MRACKNPRAVHYVRAMKGKIRSALILCAGYGSRLRPLTDRLPKPLLPAGGRPALFAAMDKLRPAGIRDFFVNVHHLPEKFAEAFGLPAGTFADSRVAEARYKDLARGGISRGGGGEPCRQKLRGNPLPALLGQPAECRRRGLRRRARHAVCARRAVWEACPIRGFFRTEPAGIQIFCG